MKQLFIFLFVVSAHAQTAAVPASKVPLPAVVIQKTVMSCPVQGKTATCTFPQTTVQAATSTTTTAVTAPVSLPFTITLSCVPTELNHAPATTPPTLTLTGLQCTITKVAP